MWPSKLGVANGNPQSAKILSLKKLALYSSYMYTTACESVWQFPCDTVWSLFTTEIQFPDGEFSMSAIARMKVMAGIDICYELAPKHRKMIKRLSLPQSPSYNRSAMDTISFVFEEWLAGMISIPPTWKKMIAVLKGTGMNRLAECIKNYFRRSPIGSKFGEKFLTTSHHVHAALN